MMRPALPEVIWIGGATGSGKTTVARELAVRFGLRRYHIDNYWYAHDALLEEPRLTPDEQWIGLSPTEQAAAFHASAARRMALTHQDLRRLPSEPPIVVEGPQVLPELLPGGAHAVFLVPTPTFQEAILRKRPLPPTRDPDRALRNRIEKDRLFGERVAAEAAARGRPVITVSEERSPMEVVNEAERLLGGAPAVARQVRPSVDFGAVRHWENEALAANIRSWISSPDMIEGPIPPWPFASECGDPACRASVPLTVDEFDAVEFVRHPDH